MPDLAVAVWVTAQTERCTVVVSVRLHRRSSCLWNKSSFEDSEWPLTVAYLTDTRNPPQVPKARKGMRFGHLTVCYNFHLIQGKELIHFAKLRKGFPGKHKSQGQFRFRKYSTKDSMNLSTKKREKRFWVKPVNTCKTDRARGGFSLVKMAFLPSAPPVCISGTRSTLMISV